MTFKFLNGNIFVLYIFLLLPYRFEEFLANIILKHCRANVMNSAVSFCSVGQVHKNKYLCFFPFLFCLKLRTGMLNHFFPWC